MREGWSIGRRALATAAVLGVAGRTAAQEPLVGGPVTLIVPYGAGTGPDLLARLVAPVLGRRLGATVAVDNRTGASGNIGSQAVARALPDGRTLLMQTTPFVINPALLREVPYDPVRNFQPVAKVATGVLALVVREDFGTPDVATFVNRAKARPGGIDYASPGIGTPQHLAMELFAHAAGIRLAHVPYRTSPPAIQDLLGGRVPAMVLPVHLAVPMARQGTLRLLAVFSEERAATAPDVPTMAEAGLAGLRSNLWYGLLGPAGMPAPLVSAMHEAVAEWLAAPATREALLGMGLFPSPAGPDAFGEEIAGDLARIAALIRTAGIVAD
ncbi:tripartite tricarboxylate transporter substrate binding protein [Roseomonas sp. KE2513]|uniref:Bug family tripartite tricarboxylate transporter substrate binding protein n=1 Tax=Roseomonas sp. KE2513 TaxID=2479202 RepID=UPI0018DFE3E9|nr:tripartite tricarboxylate transporter substrate-binding protein [Roseomonas sp. KE2513]MBI0538207.1 tripartite tricarboxylate transporter substrate binding protein [Roseomonas sp. KE2513]